MAPLLIVALRGYARCVITLNPRPKYGNTIDFSFSKCYLCSRLTLLPIFPVAHLRFDNEDACFSNRMSNVLCAD
jgi:hypothetical protein